MKILITVMILLCLMGCKQGDNILWVYADSIAAVPETSWADNIHNARLMHSEWEGAIVRNNAISGWTWKALQIPENLPCTFYPDHRYKVVISLGINDALWGEHDVGAEVRRSLDVLNQKGCHTYIVLPPRPEQGSRFDTPRWHETRNVIANTAAQYPNVKVIDVVYYWEATVDGLHPNADLGLNLAVQIGCELDLDWRG